MNARYPKAKALGLVSCGALLGAAIVYLKTPASRVAETNRTRDETFVVASPPVFPLGLSASSAISSPAAEDDTKGIPTDKPVQFTAADERYHQAVLEGLAATDSAAQENVFCQTVGAWISESPAAVEAIKDEIAERFGPNVALRITAQLWAAEDPDGALEWAQRSGNAGHRLKVVASVAYQMAQRDPLAALEKVKSELDRTPFYQAALEPLVGRWAAQDRPAALAWVRAQPEGDVRDQLINQLGPSGGQEPRPAQ